MIIKTFVSLIPVFLFLIIFLYLDSLKLVRMPILAGCLAWGLASAGSSYWVNTGLAGLLQADFQTYSRYIAPVAEEILKCSLLFVLIRNSKVGFMIDGAIYGFAVGAAFSFTENVFYLFSYAADESNLMVWIIRGFGTAIMHGGTTAIFAILCVSALNREAHLMLAALAGLVMAVLIHAFYNLFLLSPMLSAVIILVAIPLLIIFIFVYNERSVRKWFELEFDSEVRMLHMIRNGQFSQTRTGKFLVSIRHHFPPETVVDIYCFISLYLELSIKAKSIMMLRENDMVVPVDPELPRKLNEIKSLRKNIGTAGFLAISPALRMSRKDLWKLGLLSNR